MPRNRIEHFDELNNYTIKPKVVRLLPEGMCRRWKAVILDLPSEDSATIGMQELGNGKLEELLREVLDRSIHPVRLNEYELGRALDIGFGHIGGDEHADISIDRNGTRGGTTPTEILNQILLDAEELRATDIHIERYRGDTDVRLRIDGIMHQLSSELSPENADGVISRIKIISGLDIAQRKKPQDGRFRLLAKDGTTQREADYRVNITPGPHGEDAVIRALGGLDKLHGLDFLGMSRDLQETLADLLNNPEGMLFVTGPTGSGKTTTLYAALAHLNDGKRKILTAEDPIEYELRKISQKQISPWLDYSELARAFLRMDPDVMLIGEVRDEVTAEAICRAASTGHLALSTLHTTDALGTILRLATLGLSREEISNSLLGALAQRLVRKICASCITADTLTEKQAGLLGALAPKSPQKGAGCKHCHGTGYHGRVGVFELFIVDHNVQDMLSEESSMRQLRAYVHNIGFRSLLHDALEKVEAGLTTVEEVFRVLPYRYMLEITASRKEPTR
jgi:general secretion pathway protein E